MVLPNVPALGTPANVTSKVRVLHSGFASGGSRLGILGWLLASQLPGGRARA